MSEKPISLREQIEAAYEAVESGNETTNVHESETTDIPNERRDSVSVENNSSDDLSSKKEQSSENPESTVDDPNLTPVNWSQEDKDAFLELDEKGRKLYLKRYKEMEGGFTKKSQNLAEERRIAENFKKAISQHEEHLKSLGVDPFMAVDKLLQTERLFRTGTPGQKAAALQQIINDYQIQLQNSASPQNIQQNAIDPNLQALWDEQTKTRKYIENMHAQKIAQEEMSIAQQITDFASAKDSSGNLKYPHFEDVRIDMGKTLSAGMAKSMEDAYEFAVLSNKDLRQEYILRHTNEVKHLEDVKKRTAASKSAGFNVKSGSTSQISDPDPKLSRREILAKAYDDQLKRSRI